MGKKWHIKYSNVSNFRDLLFTIPPSFATSRDIVGEGGAQKLFACKIYIVFPQISLKSQKQFSTCSGLWGGGLWILINFFFFLQKKKEKSSIFSNITVCLDNCYSVAFGAFIATRNKKTCTTFNRFIEKNNFTLFVS